MQNENPRGSIGEYTDTGKKSTTPIYLSFPFSLTSLESETEKSPVVREMSGCKNIFADLEFANPEEHLAKAKLAMQIVEIIRQRRLNQTAAAAILGIDQPKVSALMRGQMKNFSLDRLCRFLNRLDKDVDIVVKDKPRSRVHGETHILTVR